MKKTELKRKTALAPGPPIERKTPIKKISKGLCATKRAQIRAYKAAADAEQCWCSICGKPGAVERSHHYPQGNYPEHRNDERNWLVMGKYCGCHRLFEDHKHAFAAKWPAEWAGIVHQMQLIDLKSYRFYAATIPELYPAPSAA
jgi:hypothetical protein